VHRKVVTVLFCDVVGSTALGESIDPEALQALLARYFERMKTIVESHEGTVEKFIGDAVVAVFGVPVVHEDDALRACRAAEEMRVALPDLGIAGRIGVNTGEVVTDTEERLAAGDAVNVAARLQQAAAPDQVLIGEATLELVGGAVEVEAVAPLELKGKFESVPAFRLLSVLGAPERTHESRFVGREAELELIRSAWERATEERRCELVTIVGDAGIGKSRLVGEGLGAIGARAVVGRCLPYGDGITYWPVIEVIKQLGSLPSDPAASASLRALLGESDTGTSAEEIAWAFRKQLEEHAPLAVVFDDVQWGEQTFLDLVESTALLLSGAPVLLVCMGRPELLDRRSAWPVTMRLAPLPEHDIDELIGELPNDLRIRVATAAGGNPLFLNEMLLIAARNADVEVPPTLRALLASRLDQLDDGERVVIERGAVEGELFHRGAVQALVPEGTQITPRLAALTRKELIRPDTAQLPGEDGFRFRHLLFRDAAYEALPKAIRAELHVRFADWLAEHGSGLAGLDEILGYHLEQATRYKIAVGQPDAAVADRAGDRLAAAGRRALWRGDERAAAGLLERALELTRPARLDVVLELDLAEALSRSRPDASAGLAEVAAERAHAADDAVAEALARVGAAYYHDFFSPDPDIDGLETLVRTALPLLEGANDHAGLVHAWSASTMGVANWRCHYEDFAHASEEALRHSQLAGQRRSGVFSLDSALANGPRPADDALNALDALLPENAHPRLQLRRAWLLTMLCRFEEAAPIVDEASRRWRELTGDDEAEGALGHIAATAGDHERAAAAFRRFCDMNESGVLSGFLQTYAPLLGRSLCVLGRHDEAGPLAQLGRSLDKTGQDIYTQALWRQVQALVVASRGRHSEAEALAREAVSITEPTDALNIQGDALCDLADVLQTAGKNDAAAAVLEQALDRFSRKKNLAMVAQVRPRLAAARAQSHG